MNTALSRSRDEPMSLAYAVETLPLRMREVLELHAYERLPYADIAAQLDLARRTVAAQLAHAMFHCLRVLDETADGGHEAAWAITESAAGWFARMRDEGITERDHSQLSSWLARDDRHRGAWLQLQQLWSGIRSLAPLSVQALPPPMEVEPPPARLRRS